MEIWGFRVQDTRFQNLAHLSDPLFSHLKNGAKILKSQDCCENENR